ncbi:unnamed protein product [Moneuplotes crassus]|uniref:Uncharacterized protein n=1 Tax=Euplotes crassus TaxID=5936 RepID=A0AAD1Y390_EUPCR|nr:unnamed protein product [Moneuplotes crassus]
MDIEASLFNVLVNCYSIKESPTFKFNESGKSVVLDANATKFMLNGLTIAKFLTYITLFLEKQIGERLGVNIDKLQTLKVSSTDQAKLYNWSILSKELEMLDLFLTPEDKRDIIQGDFGAISNLLTSMKNILHGDVDTTSLVNKSRDNTKENANTTNEIQEHTQEEAKPQKKLPKSAVDINQIKTENPSDCVNCVEFILVTLSQSLKLTGKQAAAFLAKENKFLKEACCKGLKNGFESLLDWYKLIFENSKHLSLLISQEIEEAPNTLSLVMSTIKVGINSKSEEMIDWTIKLLSKMSFEFDKLKLSEKAWEWFTSGDVHFLSTCLELVSNNPDLFTDMSTLILGFSRGNLNALFTEYFMEFYKEEEGYYEQLLSYLPIILENEHFRQEVDGFLTDKVNEIVENFETLPSDLLRSVTSSFLVELWINNDPVITQEISEAVIDDLKIMIRNSDKALQFTAISQMFKLLELFTEQKISAAPVLYKALIFVFIENHPDNTTRQFLMSNFISFFESSDTVPVGILLEPLIKQLMESEGTSYVYNTFDFDFFTVVAKHPKLKLNDAIPLMDILAKIYLNDPVFAFAASVPFMIIVTSFMKYPLLMGYVQKFITLALSNILSSEEEVKMSLESQKARKRKPIPLPPSRAKRSAKEAKKPMNQKAINEKLKKGCVIEICKKLIALQNPDINELIESLCLSIITQLEQRNEQPGQYDKGLISILDLIGNARDLIERFEREEIERLKKQAESESKVLEKVEEVDDEQEEVVKKSSQSRRKRRDYSTDGTSRNSRKRIGSLRRPPTGEETLAVVPYLKQKPKNKVDRKAFEDLDKIRKQRQEVIKKKNQEQEKIKLIEEKRKKKLKKQIELRRVELGIQKRTGSDNKDALLFKEGEVEQTAGFNDFTASRGLQSNAFNSSISSKFSKLGGVGKRFQENFKGPEVNLFEYDAEEERDVNAVKTVAKKYTKLLKYLFSKYANSGYSVKAFSNFEELNKKLQTITIAEIMKMLRDHHVTNRIIGKSKVSEIVRRVQPDSTPLPLAYPVFVEFFTQLAYVIYAGPPNNLIHLTPAETLIKLINFFEESAKSRGQSTLLYEDPDATSLGDKKVLDELNRRIKVNPSYSLPEGYTKVYEKDFEYEYKLPEYYEISEAQRVSISILDSLCDKLFDFHFIEPMVKYRETVKVRPTFKKQINQQRQPLQYMKKIERSNKLKPLNDPRASSRKSSKSRADPQKPSIDLSTSLLIEVGRYPFDKRENVTECAEVLEQILQAVNKGKSKLPTPSSHARVNKIEQERIVHEKQEMEKEKRKEEKRKKREQDLKKKVKQMQEQREKERLEKLAQFEEAEKAELERRKKEAKRKKMEKEKKRKEMEDLKKKRMEQAEKYQQEEEEREKKANLEKKKKNKQFLKQQNQKLKAQFEAEKESRIQVENKQKELQQREKDKEIKMKHQMEGFLSKNKDTRKLEVKERKEIQRFYNSEEVQSLMNLYDQQLLQMYKYYTLQGDMSIGGNLEKRMNVIEFSDWVRFGTRTNINPHLLTSDDMVAIFRTLEREMQSVFDKDPDGEEINYIEFEHFKKGLIRITILAKTQSIEKEIKYRNRKSKIKKTPDLNSKADTGKNKKLKELEDQIAKIENLQNIKIEEKRVSKEFDVSLINVDDVERLLKFLQLDSEDDKYTMDRKLTNKLNYPKTIVFDGLEGNYSDVHTIRDNNSSYSRKRSDADPDKYSVIHAPKDDKIEETKSEEEPHSQPDHPPDTDKEKQQESPQDNNLSKDAQEDGQHQEDPPKKELVAISQEELDNQPQDEKDTTNIIDPEGKKEEWEVNNGKE